MTQKTPSIADDAMDGAARRRFTPEARSLPSGRRL